MSDDDYTESEELEQAATQVVENSAILPDGIGLSIEDVRAILARQHDTLVSKDDPILMVVTLLNAFLAEIDKLHEKHAKAITKIMADKTDGYIKGVQEATKDLSDSLSSASVEGMRKVFDDNASRLSTFKSNITWVSAIVAVSALVNVAVFVAIRLI